MDQRSIRLITPFRGSDNSMPDGMSRPRIDYSDVKKFASELFNITVIKDSLTVQALAYEQSMNFFSAAYRLNLCDTFIPPRNEVHLFINALTANASTN